MAKSISDIKKSRGRPATTGTGTLIGLRLHEPELKRIDAWAKAQEVSRPEAIRRLVDIGLKRKP
jgi:hypothetical protein